MSDTRPPIPAAVPEVKTMRSDVELLDELRAAAGSNVVLLPGELGEWWVQQFARRYVSDASAQSWWYALKVPVESIEYGTRDGLKLLSTVVADWGPLVLIITDEHRLPTGCFLGLAADLISMIRKVRNFEFVVTSLSCDRWVFDIHDNALLVYRGDYAQP